MDMAAALHFSCSILNFMCQGVNRLHMRSCDVVILKCIFLPLRVINTLVLQVLVGHSLTVHLARVLSLSKLPILVRELAVPENRANCVFMHCQVTSVPLPASTHTNLHIRHCVR